MNPFRSCVGVTWAVALLTMLLPLQAIGSPRVAGLCDQAAKVAAAETGVPVEVLLAITRTETGRTTDGAFLPWPWTVNAAGDGRWFDDPDAARAFAETQVRAGKGNFDIGCFQLNYRWHAAGFASLEAMFDPVANARYAAGFLARLKAETGSWADAAAAYHSRTPEFASRYKKRFSRILAALGDPGPRSDPAPPPPTLVAAVPERPNAFPLLRGGAPGRLGSLVPGLSAGRPLIGIGG